MKKLISLSLAALLFAQTSMASTYDFGDNWSPSMTAFSAPKIAQKGFDIPLTASKPIGAFNIGAPNIQPKAGFATLFATIVMASMLLVPALPFFWGGVVIFNAAYYGKGDFYFGDPTKKSLVMKGLKAASRQRVSLMKSLSKSGGARVGKAKGNFGFNSLKMSGMKIGF